MKIENILVISSLMIGCR